MVRLIGIFSFITLLLGSILMSHHTAQAYSYTGLKICTFYVNYRWGGNIIPIHKSGFEKAVSDWNVLQSVRRFKNSGTGASGVLDTYSTTRTEYGVTNITYNDDTKCVVAWASKINEYKDTHTLTKARSTGSHELGHTLGLDHTNNTAIMNVNRDRTQVYLPQFDDTNGVESLY